MGAFEAMNSPSSYNGSFQSNAFTKLDSGRKKELEGDACNGSFQTKLAMGAVDAMNSPSLIRVERKGSSQWELSKQ